MRISSKHWAKLVACLIVLCRHSAWNQSKQKRNQFWPEWLLKEKAFQFQNNLEYIASSLFNKLLILEDTVLALFPWLLIFALFEDDRGNRKGLMILQGAPICSNKSQRSTFAQFRATRLWDSSTSLTARYRSRRKILVSITLKFFDRF